MAKQGKILKAAYGSEKTPLKLGSVEIPAYVLDNGQRVLSRNGMQKALGYEGTSGDWLVNFVNNKTIKPHISAGVFESMNTPVEFDRLGAGGSASKTYGYDATILIDLCDAIIEAKNAGELKPNQLIYAKFAEIIIRSVAKVGIVALVDEATGYQYDREKDELQKILKQYISEEFLVWQKRFPDEFYREIFRLKNWNFTVSEINKSHRPSVIGSWTKKYIYSALPQGVLPALIDKTPKNTAGKKTKKLHQSLTKEQGVEHLNKQIVSVVTLMNISDNWDEFNKHWDKKFGQQTLSFEEAKIIEPPKPVLPDELPPLSDFNQNLRQGLEWNPKDNRDKGKNDNDDANENNEDDDSLISV